MPKEGEMPDEGEFIRRKSRRLLEISQTDDLVVLNSKSSANNTTGSARVASLRSSTRNSGFQKQDVSSYSSPKISRKKSQSPVNTSPETSSSSSSSSPEVSPSQIKDSLRSSLRKRGVVATDVSVSSTNKISRKKSQSPVNTSPETTSSSSSSPEVSPSQIKDSLRSSLRKRGGVATDVSVSSTNKILRFQSPKKTPQKLSTKSVSKKSITSQQNKKSSEEKEAVEKISPLKSPGKAGEGGGGWRFNTLGVPQCPLPCRESQFEEIWTFLHENISVKHSRCLYVSGVPGTGKTVIVQSVVDTLLRYVTHRKKHNLEFQYVYINGLSLGSPDKIWKRFYCGLHGEKMKITPHAALKRLGSHFETKGGRLPIVLVIDELDQILDKKQSILYQLLEWSSDSSTMFSLVAIFNTMSLPENGLVMRNVSRMGLIRCIFPPYSHEQLQTIIRTSLASCKSEKINDDAIGLLSKRVAAVSGDARRALEIAKRTVEIIETGQSTSGVLAVNDAFKEIFSSIKINTMKNCSALEQMFLKNLSEELQRTGSEETTLMNIFSNVYEASILDGMNWTKDQFVNAATRLSMMKLIIMEKEFSSLHKRISLNVPVEDLNFALGLKVDSIDQY